MGWSYSVLVIVGIGKVGQKFNKIVCQWVNWVLFVMSIIVCGVGEFECLG